jgi:hypothetical protein
LVKKLTRIEFRVSFVSETGNNSVFPKTKMETPIESREATGKNLVMKEMIIPVYMGGFLVNVMKTYFSVKNNIPMETDMTTINKGIPVDKTMEIKNIFSSKENLFSISKCIGILAKI